MMLSTVALVGALVQTPPVDPYRLALGRPGEITIGVGEIRDTRTGAAVTPAQIAKAAADYRFVMLGESHDHPAHHQMQADVIRALAKEGRQVIVGFEMFTRPNQPNLAPWTLGRWTEEEFIERADWKKQWGFDFALYRPIFQAVREHRLPMVALNVPRDWVRTIARQGVDALPAEAKSIPLDLGLKSHRQVFESLMGGHPMGGQLDNAYRGQVLWDEGMADTAIQYLEGRFGTAQNTPANVVFVVIAGSGHTMYGAGINARVQRRTGLRSLNLTMIESEQARPVSRGLGDFVFVAPAIKRQSP